MLDVRTAVSLWELGRVQGLKCSVFWSECQSQASLQFVMLYQTQHLGTEFPGDPVVKTPHFKCLECRFDHWYGD